MRRFAMTWLEEENVLVVAKMAMHPQKHAPASTSPMRPKKGGVPVKFREWGCLAENKCFWKTSILTCVLRELVVLNCWADLSEHLGAHKYHVEFA